jgi:PleD family two-component response regulator
VVERKQRILVVDDDKLNLELVREICENAGYLVEVAQDGSTAIRSARAELPDLILLDIMMGTKDGFQVCRELRADPRTQQVPIILVTAVDDLDSKVRGIELGADDYVTKPFRLFDLQSRIRSALDRRALAATGAEDGPDRCRDRAQPFRLGGYRQLRWDLQYEFERARRYQHPLSCALLLVDGYEGMYTEQRKREAAGLIAAVVTTLQETLREVDRIYRLEDDAFLVIMPETTAAAAQQPLERIRGRLQAAEASTTGPVALTAAAITSPDCGAESATAMLRLLTQQLDQLRA